MKRVY